MFYESLNVKINHGNLHEKDNTNYTNTNRTR